MQAIEVGGVYWWIFQRDLSDTQVSEIESRIEEARLVSEDMARVESEKKENLLQETRTVVVLAIWRDTATIAMCTTKDYSARHGVKITPEDFHVQRTKTTTWMRPERLTSDSFSWCEGAVGKLTTDKFSECLEAARCYLGQKRQ